MIIRPAEKKDIEGINNLLRQVLYVHHVGRPDIFKPQGKKYTDSQLEIIIMCEDTPIFVAVDEKGTVLGHCFTEIRLVKDHSSLEDMKTLYIDDLCIDENSRGEHIGKALYEFTLDYARKIGCYNVTLNVWAENKSALKFYEAMGLSVQKYGMEKIL
ncbi:MAG: GNAT family N-acetyltransferase [Eubacteriales bacterium]|nr:GNAT family N-acetyltransferase [Eubacteriales bacterium]